MKQYLSITFYILIFALLTACGSNPYTSQDAGALTFNIKLSRPATAYQTAYLTGNDICIDYGVATVTAVVKDSSGKTITSGSWSCSAHQGTITGIPAGNNYTVKLEGKDSDNTVTWSGEKTGISISGGDTTAAGTIAMTYTGSDTTAPTITSVSPTIGLGLGDIGVAPGGVPITTLLTATFSEKMAISSVNDKTFTLTNGTTAVSGSVTYDSNTKKAIFIPATNLSYSTTYTATITTGVEDMAGNNMQADYTWNFTTEGSPTTAPSAPTGVVATAGNGQTTITWDAVTGATSYNIYWSTTAGVTKITGTKIPSISSPYIHTGRNNGTTYYYVVTAANDIYGESDTSAEVSITPVATDTTPPTGSVIINNNATYTNSTTVTLTLSATDANGVSQMCISNETTCPSSSWETYTTSKSWTLTTGDGTKTVYVWFKDGAGNTNAAPYTDSTALETTAPIDGKLTAIAGDDHVSLNWSGFSDATSGLNSYRLVYSTSATPDTCSSGTQIYFGSVTSYTHVSLIIGTIYYYRVCAVDNAGNVSAGAIASEVVQSNAVIKAVAAGGQHSLALMSDGSVWAWGYNMSGQLGDGTAFDKATPIQISELTDVTAIAGGGEHTVVLKSDSTVWTSGNNDNGQLGDRTTTNRFTPVQAGGSSFTGVTAIAAGTHHTIALKSDGTVWGWGVNVDGAGGNSPVPVQVNGLSEVTAIAAEGSHSLVLKSDGSVWAWGDNTWGQIGDLTTISRSTPVQVNGLTGVTAIAASYMHSVAIKSDGTVWTWGYNGQGQLGNGTKVSSSAPIQVSGLSGVKSIAASSDFTTALKFDGTV